MFYKRIFFICILFSSYKGSLNRPQTPLEFDTAKINLQDIIILIAFKIKPKEPAELVTQTQSKSKVLIFNGSNESKPDKIEPNFLTFRDFTYYFYTDIKLLIEPKINYGLDCKAYIVNEYITLNFTQYLFSDLIEKKIILNDYHYRLAFVNKNEFSTNSYSCFLLLIPNDININIYHFYNTTDTQYCISNPKKLKKNLLPKTLK